MQELAAGVHDGHIGAGQVFARPVDDVAHTFLHRHVLGVDAVDAAEGFGFLHGAVNHPVVGAVDPGAEVVLHMFRAASVAAVHFHPFLGLNGVVVGQVPVPDHHAVVVHWHPHMAGGEEADGARFAAVAALAGADLVERHHEVVGAHVAALVAQGTDAGVAVAVVGKVDFQFGRAALDVGGIDAEAGVGGIGAEGAVQDGGVGGVDAAFQGLQPVAFLDVFGDMAVGFRHGGPLEFGRGRHMFRRAHIGPDDAAEFQGGVGGGGHFGGEVAVGGLVHHIYALAVDVEFPAVIDAAESAFLVAAQPEGGQAVGAEFLQEADASLGVAESDQLLAQQLEAHGVAVRFRQFPGQQGGHPVAAHQVAHSGAGADAGQGDVVGLRNHSFACLLCWLGFRAALPPILPPMRHRVAVGGGICYAVGAGGGAVRRTVVPPLHPLRFTQLRFTRSDCAGKEMLR